MTAFVRKISSPATVAVVAAHAGSGHSMRRYSQLLAAAYREAGVQVVVAEPGDHLARRFASPAVRKWAAYVDKFVLFPAHLVRTSRRVDLVHVADHSDAIYCLLPALGAPTTVTVHDLFAVQAALGQVPEHRTRWTGRVYQWLVRRGLARADDLIAVSRPSQDDVAAVIGRASTVVRSPVDPALAEAAGAPSTTAGPFALVVSDAGWRKRRQLALAAWKRLAGADPELALRLVVVGPPLTGEERGMLSPGDESLVTCLSDIDDEALAALYREAFTVLTMSRYEGLCWPILEAQLLGTVPLCADEPILHDTAGEGGVFVTPDDVTGQPDEFWSSVIRELRSSERAAAADANVALFAWKPFCDSLIEHASEVVSSDRR